MWIYDDKTVLIYCSVMAFMFGAVMGSFLNCAAWRISHGESFLKGRSRCPKCGHTLGALELVPVFSWLFLRGKCRHCKSKIPVRYLLVELFFGGLTLCTLLAFGVSVECLRNYIYICCLFCLSLVDLECFIIPDGCIIIPALAWAASLPFMKTGWKDIGLHLLAALVYGGGILLISLLLDKILGRESMGGGDIKLFALNGLYLGLLPSLFSVIIACVLGLIHVLTVRMRGERKDAQDSGSETETIPETDGNEESDAPGSVTGKVIIGENVSDEECGTNKNEENNEDGVSDEDEEDTRGRIPFGPAIAASAVLMLFFGEKLVSWYLGLMNL